MKKLYLLLLVLVVLCAAGCKKETKPEPEAEPVILWSHFSYPEYNAHIYIKFADEQAEAVLCGSANKIVGRVHLTHPCTETQFETIQNKLTDHGAVLEDYVAEPAIEGYPDMTAYLSMFMSKEKQEEIWKGLVEE